VNIKMTTFSLEGKVAVLTGASRGIGRAIALELARAGAKVVVSSRKLENVAVVVEEIEALGGEALAVQAHVGQADELNALVERTLDSFGRLDVIINNAATNPHFGPLLTADEGLWDKILETNTKSVFRLCKAAVPHMQAQGSGKIINMASMAGAQPSPGLGLYGVSKAALIMLTKVLALELASANIQVNAIAPGMIKTRFSRTLWGTPQIAEHLLRAIPQNRFGEPQDVAGLALYLASSASDYITGEVFFIDGGMTVSWAGWMMPDS
jgi:NAD(P)-dependent dehydrogenase (short-subunit alcohol dehydrogenase family)